MRVLRDEQQLCPCYKERHEFQKLVELKDSGLVVYCHRPRKEDIRQAEAVESAVNTSRDVFILYNKKDVKITTSELTSELETKNISCPRCRKTFEHAQKLMQEVNSIDRKIVMGICDHCRKNATTKTTTTAKTIKKPFCACDEIVKKFIYVKGEQKEDIKKYVKIWLSKMGYLLKDDIMLHKPKEIKTRAYSDLQINRDLNSPESRHEPEIQQMFYSGTHKSDMNLNTEMRVTNLEEGYMKQAVAVRTTFARTPHESEKINIIIPNILLEDSDTTLVEKYVKELPRTSLKDRKQEEVFEDGPSIDAKEALKRRHDLSLRQMMRFEKDSRVPYSVLKRPDIYETPKIIPWVQKEPTPKYHMESEVDIKIPTLKHDRGPRGTRDLDYVSSREVKFISTRASQDSYYEPKKADKYHHDKIKQGLYDSEEGPKKFKKLDDRYIRDEELKLRRSVDKITHKSTKSDQHVAKSKSWHIKELEPKESVGFVLKPQYSFFFQKVMEKEEKQIEVDVSSSHLIKDTQEKFRLQVENDMKRREEERQQKLEQNEKKKLAREEKILQTEEKKRQAVEDKKYAEDQKRQQDKAKRDKTKGQTFDIDEEIFSEFDQKGKTSKESGVAKKYTKSELHRIDEELDKAKKGTISKESGVDKKDTQSESHRIDEQLDKAKKGTISKSEQEDQIDKVLQKGKKDLKSEPEKGDKMAELLEKAKKDLKFKPEKGRKIDELLQEAKTDLKSKPEKRDKIDEVLEKTKKDVKGKIELKEKGDDEVRDKGKKDLKEKPSQKSKDDDLTSKAMKDQKKKRETRDKDDEITEKGKKDLKRKPESIEKGRKSEIEQKDKGAEKEQKKKTEKEERDEKLQRELDEKQNKEKLNKIEQLRKEKEALKQQAAKERDELSKEKKSTKKKRDSSKEIKVSMSEIQKSIKKGGKDESANEPELYMKKQEEKKGKEERDGILQRELEEKQNKEKLKQIEQLRKEKEAFKQQAAKERDEPSKEKKSTKKKPDSSKEIKVSMSEIQKSIKKGGKDESENEREFYVKKQEGKKEKEERDGKLQRELEEKQNKEKFKQIEQLRKEKEALKQQAAKERDEPSKEKKSTKKKPDSSKEIKVSMSEIQKSIKKGGKDESENEREFYVKKQEGKKEKEERDGKLQKELEEKQNKEKFKQIEQLRKEKEALKQQAAKERDEPSKEKKSTKKKPDSSKEIKVSMSEIQKSIKKGGKDESENEREFYVKKQEGKKEKEERDGKLQRELEEKQNKEKLKQIEQLRKHKEAFKQQAAKERDEPSKEKKSTKKKRDSSIETEVSMSKIQKSIKKGGKDESANEPEFYVKKQEGKKEKEERDGILQRELEEKQNKEKLNKIEQLRKEKEQAAKERDELSKEKKSTKEKRDSSKEIKVSMSKIQKSIKKGVKDEFAKEPEFYVKKQEGKKATEERDEKLQRELEEKQYKEILKQVEQLRKQKEALKQQAAKERDELSKEKESTKKKRDSSKEIKVSISEIQKSIKKGGKDESANEPELYVKKREEKRENEEKQKETKVQLLKLDAEFRKLQADRLKRKEDALKKKNQPVYEAKVAKANEENKDKAKNVALNVSGIRIKSIYNDDLILRLVQIKQAATTMISKIDPGLIMEHKLCHHELGRIWSLCPLCINSELELDFISLDSKINPSKEIITDIIIGEKIFKIKRRLEKTKEPEVDPKLYRKIIFVESVLPPKETVQIFPQEAKPKQKQILSKKDAKEIDMEPGKGVLRYALSDRTFIDKGWTMLPTEKVVRKMNVYRMRPAHPEFDWFEHNKNKRLMTYDTGERLAEFDDNGRGRWYYRNGRLALDYYDAEETNAQQRFVIYSSGEPDERGRTHPITILATFDYLGNGIVFDHTGKIRLKYNQTEGVVLDRGIGPVSHWKWHTLNDPPVLQQVMIDTQMAHKDPNILKLGSAAERATRPDNEEMLAIEFDNFIKEKSKKLSQKFKPFQIKMKALKVNEHFSLKVLDQATVYLIFRDGSTNLKLNIGMILDHQEIVDTDTAEVGEVSNSLERFPARTDSLAGLQRSVAHAQRYERLQTERERRLRLPEPCVSADQLTAAASPPLRLPLRTVPTGSSSSGYCSRKPTNNLYYNTRLL